MRPSWFVAIAIVLLSACAPKPPKLLKSDKPKELIVTLAAADELNVGPTGQSSPVAVQVILLKDDKALAGADYFAITENPAAALAGSELALEKVFISPGSEEAVTLEVPEKDLQLGIAVGFRDYQNGNWRLITPVPTKKKKGKLRVNVSLEQSEITLNEGK